MTHLLVSVRSAAEASAALAGGADLIDMKEPSRGALGAAPTEVWREVADTVAGRVPLSVALGELIEASETPPLPPADCSFLQFAKLGLRGCQALRRWQDAWLKTFEPWPAHVQRVAVSYADWRKIQAPPPEEVIDVGAELGCRVWLIDTCDKTAGGLLDYASPGQLRAWMDRARNRGLQVALAGSLTLAAIDKLRPLCPNWFAVRGAVCREGREGTLDAAAVRGLKLVLHRKDQRESVLQK